MQNWTEIRQCLRCWRPKIFMGHTFAIQVVRALWCACFQKKVHFFRRPGFGGLRLYVRAWCTPRTSSNALTCRGSKLCRFGAHRPSGAFGAQRLLRPVSYHVLKA